MLFTKEPDRFVPGAYVKIGFFVTDDDLRYQDEVHGNLFAQIDKVMDLLQTKYMKAYIRYEGLQRVEEFLFPPAALREALLNALAHKDYRRHTGPTKDWITYVFAGETRENKGNPDPIHLLNRCLSRYLAC